MNMLFNQFCLQCLFKIRAVRDVFLIVFPLKETERASGLAYLRSEKEEVEQSASE